MAKGRLRFLDESQFLQASEILYVLFQCLVHARQNVSSRSPVWTVLYHPPDRGRKLSRKLLALVCGQEEASHQASGQANEQNDQP